jgi:hypothetical protein
MRTRTGWRRALAVVLLTLPVVALLAVPVYDRTSPALGGVPFFYWYQLAWVPLTALLLAVASRLRTPPRAPAPGGPPRPEGPHDAHP